MKQMTLLVAAGCLVLSVLTAGAQTASQNSPDSPEMQYLRRLIAEQQKNPDRILRALPNTNAPVLNRTEPKVTVVKPVAPPIKATPAPASPAKKNSKTTPAPDEAVRREKISDVETRLNAIARQKEAREQAALTNAAPAISDIPATPQTKRQRLDALLKQMIDGKISGAEYSEKREKIVAEID